jgi:predicted outer membrane repeat protein
LILVPPTLELGQLCSPRPGFRVRVALGFAPARSWSAGPFDDQIFDYQPGTTATISGLTITGGDGGVRNYEGDLTLDRVAVTGNTADLSGFGGGIYSTKGTLNLTESTLSYKIRQPTKQALSS